MKGSYPITNERNEKIIGIKGKKKLVTRIFNKGFKSWHPNQRKEFDPW